MPPDLRLTNLSPVSRSIFYLRATSREHDDAAADMTLMLRWIDGAWGNYEIDAPVVAHVAFESNGRRVFSLTPDGEVHVAAPEGFAWEKLDNDEAGSPNRLRQMRDLKRVGDSLFAVGMARMAYERSPTGQWQRIDEGMRDAAGGGLLSVDGCDRTHVYACGFGGQIWHFDGARWVAVDSPTNVKLEQVLVCAPDEVLLTGARGLAIVGNGKSWKVLNPTAARSTLWGLAKFDGRVYAADNAHVYVVEGDDLVPEQLPFEGRVTTGRLQVKDGMLWSIGESDLLSFDGMNWARLNYE